MGPGPGPWPAHTARTPPAPWASHASLAQGPALHLRPERKQNKQNPEGSCADLKPDGFLELEHPKPTFRAPKLTANDNVTVTYCYSPAFGLVKSTKE